MQIRSIYNNSLVQGFYARVRALRPIVISDHAGIFRNVYEKVRKADPARLSIKFTIAAMRGTATTNHRICCCGFRDACFSMQAYAGNRRWRLVSFSGRYTGKLDHDVGCVTNWWPENQMGFMVLRSLGGPDAVCRIGERVKRYFIESPRYFRVIFLYD